MSVEVKLEYSLNVMCKECNEGFDLAEQDEDGVFSSPIFNNKWDELKGEAVVCPHCGFTDYISDVVY